MKIAMDALMFYSFIHMSHSYHVSHVSADVSLEEMYHYFGSNYRPHFKIVIWKCYIFYI